MSGDKDNRQQHWETVYRTRDPESVSWHAPHLEHSLALIGKAAPGKDAAIFDAGGGASSLAGDLLARGYRDITVLDLSAAALEVARDRLGASASRVNWQTGDILTAPLAAHRYDIWHDRALFHFLTDPQQRAAYVRQMTRALKPGGYAIIAAFGPEGPQKCSNLDTMRYDAEALARALGNGFQLIEAVTANHKTPSGTEQQFLHALFRKS